MTKEQILQARQTLGLSQAEFAELILVSSRTVKYWESGERNPSKLAVQRMKDFTGGVMGRLTAKQQQDRARLRSIKLAERTAKSRYFSSVYGTGEKVQPHDMNGKPCGISMEEAKAVELAVLPWRVVCYALCRHPVDGDYLKSMALSFSPCRQSEVNRALSEAHYDWMVRECNISQVLTLAWIATTADEPSDYIATKIFGDAWDQFDPVVMMEDGKYQTRPRNDEVQAAIQE